MILNAIILFCKDFILFIKIESKYVYIVALFLLQCLQCHIVFDNPKQHKCFKKAPKM